jgi:hypothetical protein
MLWTYSVSFIFILKLVCLFLPFKTAAYYADVPVLVEEHYVASAYVGQGLMPAAPYLLNVVITIHTLKTFRAIQFCCPCLGVQAFVCALCDIHGITLRPYLGAQFSAAFNVYLSIRVEIDTRQLSVATPLTGASRMPAPPALTRWRGSSRSSSLCCAPSTGTIPLYGFGGGSGR